MAELPEEQIITMCRMGDRKAFDLLVRTHGRCLYGYIHTMTHNHAATDEILQETFLRAFTRIEDCDPATPFRFWLFRIARNASLDYLKSETRRTRREKHDAAAAPPAHGGDVETLAARREEAARLQQAMRQLPKNQRTVMGLFAVAGFSIREIARIMGCSEGTVMSHLGRARQTLRKTLAPKTEIGKDA